MTAQQNIKIVVIGDQDVGNFIKKKTEDLMMKFFRKNMSSDCLLTKWISTGLYPSVLWQFWNSGWGEIEDNNIISKLLTYVDQAVDKEGTKRTVTLNLWDTLGQVEFGSPGAHLVKGKIVESDLAPKPPPTSSRVNEIFWFQVFIFSQNMTDCDL